MHCPNYYFINKMQTILYKMPCILIMYEFCLIYDITLRLIKSPGNDSFSNTYLNLYSSSLLHYEMFLLN